MGRGPLARHWESVSVLSAVLANPPGFDRQATQNARGSAADEPTGTGMLSSADQSRVANMSATV